MLTKTEKRIAELKKQAKAQGLKTTEGLIKTRKGFKEVLADERN